MGILGINIRALSGALSFGFYEIRLGVQYLKDQINFRQAADVDGHLPEVARRRRPGPPFNVPARKPSG